MRNDVFCWSVFCWSVFCFVCCCLLGCSIGPQQVTYDYEKAHAAVTLAKYAALPDSGPAPTPEPTPTPNGKCENCNGTGKVGDGRVFVPCPKCGGDGITSWPPASDSLQVCIGDECQPPETVEQPKVIETVEERSFADKEQYNPTIIVYSRDGCIWCDRWAKTVMPKLLEADQKILWMKPPDDVKQVPTFVLVGKDRTMVHVGFMSIEDWRIKSAGL